MPAKGKGASSKKSGGQSSRKTKRGDSTPAESSTPVADTIVSTHDAENFTRGVIIRGEAAEPGESGSLPPGATHEIVGEDEKGLPIIQRRRYSAF